MPLSTGSRLGPYEIVSRLGAGGMGEVWKARDTRLDRSVAVKILPAELAANAQSKFRFEREARTISQLEHPNICRLYDVGDDYLVMELLEGESLADRLAKGPLPLPDVLRWGAQIADALDRAHRAGITHRDLKPGNVMITKSGAKLLDFGLAKSRPAVELDAATVQKPLTQEGTILGTFQYMAPEQLEGGEADARTDIFALGAMLYEMATGRRTFEGATTTSLIASILRDTPRPISDLLPLAPNAFEHVVFKCLEKDPEARWQSAHDIAEELRWIAETAPAIAGTAAPTAVRRRELVAWSLVGLLLAAALVAGWGARTTPRLAGTVTRLSVPGSYTLGLNGMTSLAISPDGRRIVTSVVKDGIVRLHVRSLDRFDSAAIPGTENGVAPFFSPNGLHVGFFSDGLLKRVSLSGGAVQTICVAGHGRGGAWADDDTIYFTPTPPAGIWKVPANGGKPVPVTTPNAAAGENSHRWPQLLPGGKHLLMTVRTESITSFDDATIAVLSLKTGRWETIVQGGFFARYVPTGHLLFARGRAIHAQRFDLETLRPTGTPVAVLSGVVTNPGSGAGEYAFGDDGTLIYFEGASFGGLTTLMTADRSGKPAKAETGDRSASVQLTRTFFTPAVSPGGRHVALAVAAANDDIWVLELARMALTRVTFESGDESDPVWSPDGKTVYFGAGSGSGIIARAADGGGSPRLVTKGGRQVPGSVSPDGKWLAFTGFDSKTGADLHLARLDGSGTSEVFLQTPFSEGDPRFSPDGRWIAYASNESGQNEVYVRAVAQGGGRWQVSTGGGVRARWSRGGDEIYFQDDRGILHAAPVRVDAAGLQIGTPRPLFTTEPGSAYDVMPDGRFLVISPPSAGSASAVNVVLNWFADLEKRVPR